MSSSAYNVALQTVCTIGKLVKSLESSATELAFAAQLTEEQGVSTPPTLRRILDQVERRVTAQQLTYIEHEIENCLTGSTESTLTTKRGPTR